MTIHIADEEFVDLQVNGYAGVDFNSDALTLDGMHSACVQLRENNVSGVLATIITADADHMAARLRKIVQFRQQDALIGDVIWGIHIEGPFISPKSGFVGAHPAHLVRPADLAVMQRLLDSAGGLTRIVTLAPEHDVGFKVTQFLTKQGIVVAAGHCDPSLEILRASIEAGLTMFTHLGNGCPAMLHRHENVIQRVLSQADRLWITLIADGAHVPFMVLGNFLRLIGTDRAIVVTDATAAAGMGPGRYTVGDVKAIVGADLVPRLDSDPQYLAGSALTMPRAADLLRRELGLDEREIALLCVQNARTCLRR